jgi:WD40 repeat protein
MKFDRLRFSPNGRSVAYLGNRDKTPTIRVMDLETGTERSWPTGHVGFVDQFAFRPDNQRLLSVGRDRRVKLWDVATGTCTLTLPQPDDVTAAAFSDDGRNILLWRGTGETPNAVIVYHADPPKK